MTWENEGGKKVLVQISTSILFFSPPKVLALKCESSRAVASSHQSADEKAELSVSDYLQRKKKYFQRFWREETERVEEQNWLWEAFVRSCTLLVYSVLLVS